MFKKPVVWIVFVAVSIAATVFTVRFFSTAFPIVALDVRMDRKQALEAADALAQERGWGPEGYRQAVSFGLDGELQVFVELEGGGTEKFRELITGDMASPYRWFVRHFQEGETNETLIAFTPEGEAEGFRETLPDDEEGAELDVDAARVIALAGAEEWELDLSGFDVVEEKRFVRESKRVDHSFVYERPDVKLGDGAEEDQGRFRVRLTVSGDRFTELWHFVDVPESFNRRFAEMRSSNDTIALVASVFMFIAYIGVGCLVGMFILLKRRSLLWKPALAWALFIGVLQFFLALNSLPLAWMGYDTATPALVHVLQQVGFALAALVGMGGLMAISFMAAEGLTRLAFPKHPRLWELWSRDVAATPGVLGRTGAGFLLVSVFFAYEVVLYFLMTNHLGWWSPASAAVDPDVLATYLPWLPPIAISAQAGFWEECLFRAVPLAGAALIGEKLGGRKYWIFGTLILQAVIFGAAHANYPAQPSYARVIELIIPSLFFGIVYLSYGLLPAVLLHFAYDVVWVALPLFTASGPSAVVNQVLVIVLTFIPLALVFAARARVGKWNQLGDEYRNGSWEPPPEVAREPVVEVVERPPLPAVTRMALLAGGVLGLVLWAVGGFVLGGFERYSPQLQVSRTQAETWAREVVTERGFELDDSWETLSSVQSGLGNGHDFAWREGGEEPLRQLIGTFLGVPRWRVRFARFEGDVADRAEEFRVTVTKDKESASFRHVLPEGREGESLDEEDARFLALTAMQEKYGVDVSLMDEVTATPTKRPNREDWTFEWADRESHPLPEGESRYLATVAGDEVVRAGRYVHVPEQWLEDERKRQSSLQVLGIVGGILGALLFATAAIGAIVAWARGRFSVKTCLVVSGATYGLFLLSLANSWPMTRAQFDTAQPYGLQMVGVLAGGGVLTLLLAGALGLVAGWGSRWNRVRPAGDGMTVLAGLGVGVLLAGVAQLVSALSPSLSPAWGSAGPLAAWSPLILELTSPLTQAIGGTALLLLGLVALDRLTDGWTRRQGPGAALTVGVVLLLGGIGAESVGGFVARGLVAGLFLLAVQLLVLRFDMTVVPLLVAGALALGRLGDGMQQAHPTQLLGASASAILLVAIGWLWSRSLRSVPAGEPDSGDAGGDAEPDAVVPEDVPGEPAEQ